MQIVCPNCATSYQVEPASLGATGRSVRCVRCRTVWFARDPAPLAAIAEAHRADIETFTGRPDPMAASATLEAPAAAIADTAVSDAEMADVWAQARAASAEGQTSSETGAGWADGDTGQGPVAVDDAPGLAPTEQDAVPAIPVPAEDIETLAARRFPERKRGWHWLPHGLPLAIFALFALNVALIAWRVDVVRVAPQTASLYAAIGLPVNVRGLALTDVATSTEMQDGVQVLLVEGTIASVSARAVEVPRLRFAVRNASGEEVYTWTAQPERSMLAPGEALAFRARLASPPPEGRDVLVRFFNRRDLVAGLR
jgi:predicted Zn finger-like uncharacterized protein